MQEIIQKINKLKKERNAVILAHNYQIAEVQDVADYHGDSLGLSIEASKTKADVIVFCGVHFMAETAAIISPNKTILMPDILSGCPMADMITVPELQYLKLQNPKAKVVCYVNSSAAIKAESDICCTSANSVKVCQSLDCDEIIFVPDKYLGLYTQSKINNKKLIFWEGYCPTHVMILPQHIKDARKEHPKAIVMVHPECRPETIKEADQTLSTGGMEKFAKESKTQEFIVATEVGMVYRLQKDNPKKKFYPATKIAVCPNMKKTNLEKILWSLEDLKEKIVVKKEITKKAYNSINKMIIISEKSWDNQNQG